MRRQEIICRIKT